MLVSQQHCSARRARQYCRLLDGLTTGMGLGSPLGLVLWLMFTVLRDALVTRYTLCETNIKGIRCVESVFLDTREQVCSPTNRMTDATTCASITQVSARSECTDEAAEVVVDEPVPPVEVNDQPDDTLATDTVTSKVK